jgi:hypothetical protein
LKQNEKTIYCYSYVGKRVGDKIKSGEIVANDNYEVLKLKSKYKVETPERFKTKA